MQALLGRRGAAAETTPPARRAGTIPFRSALLATAALMALAAGTRATQDAAANGDTRTLSLVHEHTKESATITFKRDGRYDRAALDQLNWLLRDWRLDEQIRMEPKLFDAVWEAYRTVGSREPIHVVSAYRSPRTNAALRRRSRAVAEHSQHMLGKAMDFYLTDVSMDQVRAAGMRLQNGGVGYYPSAYNPFVHIDAGSVRHWPRMSHDQLARLFPDGKTVHLPSDNRPLERYEEARAEVLARGGSVMGYQQVAAAEEYGGGRSLWQMLFGGGDDEDSSFYGLNNSGPGKAAPRRPEPAPRAVATARTGNADDAGTRTALAYAADSTDPLLGASRNVRGLRAAPQPVEPEPAEQAALPEAPATARPVAQPPAVAAMPVALSVPMPAALAGPMPLPPRRPADLGAPPVLAGLIDAPLPPSRPRAIVVASADPDALPVASAHAPARPIAVAAPAPVPRPRAPETRAPEPTDERSQLRALFSAAASPVPVAARPVQVAATRARADAPIPGGLVSAAASGVAAGFSTTPPDSDLAAARFSGPAVRPIARR